MPARLVSRGIVSRPADQAMRELADSMSRRSTPKVVDKDQAEERRFLTSQGAQVLQMANTYKRTLPALAEEISMSLDDVQAVVDGKASRETMNELLSRMLRKYRFASSSLVLDEDDTNAGVVHYTKHASYATHRLKKKIFIKIIVTCARRCFVS